MRTEATISGAENPGVMRPSEAVVWGQWTLGAWRLDPALVLAFCATFVLVLCLPPILNDGDTLWQIRTGEWILAHRAIPSVDPFSFTAGDRPWFAHEWLSETLMALAYGAAGMAGVMALAATAVGLTAAILLHWFRRFLPGLYAVVALVVALSNAAPSMLARPHLLAWPCLALWCVGLLSARANRIAPSFWLLPVMVLWVNLHGSFMAGLVLPGFFLAEALLDAGTGRRETLVRWGAFILASLAAALLNPNGLSGTLFPIHHVGLASLAWIGEWQATDFGAPQPMELLLVGALLLGLSRRLVLPPVRIVLFLGLVHAALAHSRNQPLLGLIGMLLLAEPLGVALGRGAALDLGRIWRHGAMAAACLAAIGLGWRAVTPLPPERTGAAFAAVLDRVPPAVRARNVLNEYGLGGALIFSGGRPFVDSRADLYGDAFLNRYIEITTPGRGDALDRALASYDIGWTLFPSGHRLIATLDRNPGWRRLIEAGGLVIHIRE